MTWRPEHNAHERRWRKERWHEECERKALPWVFVWSSVGWWLLSDAYGVNPRDLPGALMLGAITAAVWLNVARRLRR